MLIILVLFIVLNKCLYSQDSFIEIERIKTSEEFKESNVDTESIPQSQLLEELKKPGNEQILEQYRNSFTKEGSKDKIEMEDLKEDTEIDETDEYDGTEDKKNEDQSLEDDEDKAKISSITEMLFDRDLYYKSIKDFYGYKIFFYLNPDKKPIPVVNARSNSNHIVSPGDSFILSLWGSTELRSRITVSAEGTVFIKNVGLISIHGLRVHELEVKLKKIMTKRYKTLNPQNGHPTTYMDISYDRLNTINVFVNGEIVAPGPYELSSNSTIITALIKAGGVNAKGSLRDIQVIRGGEIIQHFDVYDYLSSGKDVLDMLLKPNDNIFVKTRSNTISLKGEVFNPLKYELKDDETLNDLIKFSGGLLSTASLDRVKIERITPKAERNSPVVYTNLIDVPFTTTENNKVKVRPIKLSDLDEVTVFTIPKMLTNYIALNGAVYRKGRYAYRNGMKLSELISKSGGLLADAFLDKVELIRTYPDTKNEYISLNLNNRKDNNFTLQALDSVNIYSKWDLINKKLVLVTGYIRNPGFTLLNDSTRVSDIIFSRGGIEDEDQKKYTYMKRADIIRFNEDGLTTRVIPINLQKALNGNKEHDLFLVNNDHLKIYNMSIIFDREEVNISGYVKNPGNYILSKNMTVEDLILTANGFQEGAYKYEAQVFRKNIGSEILSKVYRVKLDKNIFSAQNSEKKFSLQDDDFVVIRRDRDKDNQKVVYLYGQVKFPGLYTIERNGETLRSLISRAGGVTQEAFIHGIEFERDSVKIYSDFQKAIHGKLKSDIILKDGDRINIPSHPSTVSVEGFVYTPGLLSYRDDWGLDDYIEAAGGIREELESKVGNIIVYYPGGNAEVDGWFFSPSVKEGSKIVVPSVKRDPDKQWVMELRGWMNLLTSAISVALLVQAAQN